MPQLLLAVAAQHVAWPWGLAPLVLGIGAGWLGVVGTGGGVVIVPVLVLAPAGGVISLVVGLG